MSLEYYAVLIIDGDDQRVFALADEIKELFATADLAEEAIGRFLGNAADAGFAYCREDFVIYRTKP
jgi:hypothetical protein